MSKPRLLDLFCGGGGCSVGYARAGFEVVGVDKAPQPDYPFLFVQADALEFAERNVRFFDAIHASPPCQAYSALRAFGNQSHKEHLDLIQPVRELLVRSGLPYIIENVPGAPLHDPVVLCGQYFGLGVRRHRLFECSFKAWAPPCKSYHKPAPIAVYGDHPSNTKKKASKSGYINRAHTLAMGQAAMGIDWMRWRPLTQAIPPVYTAFLGQQLLYEVQGLQAAA